MPRRGGALVIGGSGFLGSHVADALQDAGHDVAILDRRPSPYLRRGQRMVVGDALDPKTLRAALRGRRFVYHFAGIAGIEEANDRPIDAVRENILSTATALEEALRAGVRRFVYASSIYVYGAAGGIYRITKLASEQWVEEYGLRGLPWTILRFGSIYGPRAGPGNIVYEHIRQALLEGRIEREGDGSEIREYIHVLDAARGAVEVLAPAYEGQSVIISGRSPMKVRDFLRLLAEILGKRVQVRFVRPKSNLHYGVTPFTFRPRMGLRLLPAEHIDLGEGIFHYVHEVHEALEAKRPARRR